ncbi:MAG TPA: hypothetical protein VL547_11590 [Dinghuibacter sp.]|uniref:hypothetical protein n=1 Tax=Dinghuibacter sp. TaxID=2024697 RepID=UPI002C1E8E1B|nr:hypothetical protein [Dinghuibacter sp.]HTJ12664.1 hypothetical protein [Dinghuibacter sp.]
MKRKKVGIWMSLFGVVSLGLVTYLFMDGVESALLERVLLGGGAVGTVSFFVGFWMMPLKKSV